MRRHIRRLGQFGLAVVVLGALGFGAAQALATTGHRECSLGDYPDPLKLCDKCCHDVLGFDGGDCYPSGNCLCF
jgi:hypothetical protein